MGLENQVNQETGDQGNNQQQQQASTESLGWRAALPDEYKEHEFVKDTTKPGDFVKKALDVKTERDLLNDKLSKAIFKPDENATDEQKAAYRVAMGIPDKPEDYEIPVPEGESTEMADSFRQFAVEKGLPKDMAKETVSWWNGIVQKAKEDYAKELKTRSEAIKTKWGLDYDKNAETIKSFFQYVKDLGINEFASLQVIGPDNKPVAAGNHPVVMEAFLELAKKTMPDSGLRSLGGGDGRTLDEKAKDFYKT